MSIYASMFRLKVETNSQWTSVLVVSVPPHIGTPEGDYDEDPYGAFLPPPVDPEGPYARAVLFVDETSRKGTERSGQEYPDPLLVVTGEEFERMPFPELYGLLRHACSKRTRPWSVTDARGSPKAEDVGSIPHGGN